MAKDYPNLKIIGTQLRAAITADRISWGAVLYDVAEDKMHLAAVRENIEIADRTGGGDSFMSGVAAALMKGNGPDIAVAMGRRARYPGPGDARRHDDDDAEGSRGRGRPRAEGRRRRARCGSARVGQGRSCRS